MAYVQTKDLVMSNIFNDIFDENKNMKSKILLISLSKTFY